jgi:HlyD family secretion protein
LIGVLMFREMSENKVSAFASGHRKALALIAVGAIVLIGVVVWAVRRGHALPEYIAFGNGRIEATEYDVATKLAGRLAELAPQEGDTVERGKVVGRLAAQEENAEWAASLADARAAEDAGRQAEENVRSAEAELALARSNFARSDYLVKQRAATADRLDRDRSALRSAEANLAAARAKVQEARSSLAAAKSSAKKVGTHASDADLLAPVHGRVLFRLVEPGAMLAVGGKVLTLLDLSDMHLTVFLPTEAVGKLAIGDEALIVLDAFPDETVPARVIFVSPRNQFTPREVETHREREKLMFRVKVRIDERWLADHGPLAKPGMPGMAYLRLDRQKPWPERLTKGLPNWKKQRSPVSSR